VQILVTIGGGRVKFCYFAKIIRRRPYKQFTITVASVDRRKQSILHSLWGSRREDNEWVKKCTQYEVEGARPRGRPKKTWREIVEKDYWVRGLNREVLFT